MRNIASLAFLFTIISSTAHADTDRYSLPWQLRPVTSDNVLRLDNAVTAFKDDNGNLDIAASTIAAASYQLTQEWSSTMRLGFVGNNAPGAALDGRTFANPVIGATYARRIGTYRLAVSLATTIPIGTGGGDSPDPRIVKTNAAFSAARPIDEAMFAVDYLTESVGGDLAYVSNGFTAQAEATLLQSVRVRGAGTAAGAEAFRTNAVVALHLGYFLGSHVSLSGDLRYQRWLSRPAMVDTMSGERDTFAIAAGPRLHFHLGKQIAIHPGISYTREVDAWSHAIAIDVPVMF